MKKIKKKIKIFYNLANKLRKKIGFLMIIIGFLILFFLVKKAGIKELFNLIIKLNPLYIFIAIFMMLISLLLGAYRLKGLISSHLKYFEVFKVYVYGLLLNYGAAIQGLGVVAKIGLLKKKKVAISKSSSGISSEIVYDVILTLVISIIFVLSIGSILLNKFKGLLVFKSVIIIFIIGFIFLLAIYLLRKKIKFLQNYLDNFLASFRIKSIIRNIVLTFLIWLFSSLTVFFVFKGSGNIVNLWWILGSVSIGFILGLISFIPGGLGVRDAIWAYSLSLSGLPVEFTVAIALITRFLSIFFIVVLVIFIEIYNSLLK